MYLFTESTAQVQIKLHYSQEEQILYVGVQKIRNLQAWSLKEDEPVYVFSPIFHSKLFSKHKINHMVLFSVTFGL